MIRVIVILSALGLLFLAAGRLVWTRAWLSIGVMLLTITFQNVIVRSHNPELIRERRKKHVFAARFDRIFFVVMRISALAALVVPGLDAVRFGWSSLPLCWMYVGAAMYMLGDIPIVAAMLANPFLVTTVRIQQERGHRVIDTGPYSFVRHPMYAGVILMCLGWPLMIGSLWTYIPIGILCAAFAVRAALEDRTLRRELPGYEEYCTHTRYRLLPGVW